MQDIITKNRDARVTVQHSDTSFSARDVITPLIVCCYIKEDIFCSLSGSYF